MIRVPAIVVSVIFGLGLGAGIAFAQQNDIASAQSSIDDAIVYLQRAAEGQRSNDPSLDARRVKAVRALAFLLLAKTELEGNPPVQGLR